MTLLQVLNRIKLIALSHKQVRNFYKGLVTDFLTDHTTLYPSVFLQDNGGTISLTQKITTLNYRMFILDLVHVSQNQKENENDVHSDMLSIAQDLIAQMNFGAYNDWKIDAASIQFLVENDGDMNAGVVVDFSVSTMYNQSVCAAPTDIDYENPIDEDMNKVYDMEYIATGNEGTTITIAILKGQKILLVTRESSPLHKVSNNPDSAEYTWDDTDIKLGTPTNPPIDGKGERFLILYRQY